MQKTALIVGRKIVPTNPTFTFLTLNTGETIVAPTKDSEGQSAVTFAVHRKGDTFVATRDSKRLNASGDPIYVKGDKVERLQDSTEVLGYTTVEVWKALN